MYQAKREYSCVVANKREINNFVINMWIDDRPGVSKKQKKKVYYKSTNMCILYGPGLGKAECGG
jgi:hypothetical protein